MNASDVIIAAVTIAIVVFMLSTGVTVLHWYSAYADDTGDAIGSSYVHPRVSRAHRYR
jgi:SNF family Na+-dependent transporter